MSERNRTVLRRVGAGGLRGRCCMGQRDWCLLLWLGLGLRLALVGESMRGCVRRLALLELEAVVASVLVAPMTLGGLSGDRGEDCLVEVTTGFIVAAIRLVLWRLHRSTVTVAFEGGLDRRKGGRR